VHDAAERLHNPRGMVDYIDYFTGPFSRFAKEFGALNYGTPFWNNASRSM
jgi:hypothetical protein